MIADDHGSGLAARRVVARWAWRMFRREWRQQALVVALVTFAVAVAAFGVCAAYNVVPTATGDFGTANHRLRFQVADVADASAQLDRVAEWFGVVEVIGHREVRARATAKPIELRAQDPRGPLGAPMLGLRAGRFPNLAGEVAITDGAADLVGASVGETIVLDDHPVTVVGMVENPARLDDEFILEPPAVVAKEQAVTVLITAELGRVADLPASIDLGPIERRPSCHAALLCLTAGQSEQATAAAGALGLATLLLLLVALVAASGFVVVAQRRQRQLGLLAANGATQRHVRLVVVTNGALVGSIAAVAGASLGTAIWVPAAQWFERPSGHRIDRLHVPVWLLLAAMALATVISIGAAWSPARRVARVPIMTALSARPPRPKPLRRSAIIAFTALALGVLALSKAIDRARDEMNPLLLIGGVAALVIGVVFLAPGVLGAFGRLARRVHAAPRLALRDLARHRARSSAALAAVSLGLAIAVGVIVVASHAESSAGAGNLSTRQLIFRVGDDPLDVVPARSVDQLDRLQITIDAFAKQLDATTTALDIATDPEGRTSRGTEQVYPVVVLSRDVGSTYRDIGPLYTATPAVIARLGLTPSIVDTDADVLTPHTGSLVYANTASRPDAPRLAAIARPAYSSMPTSLLTPAAVARQGWTTTRGGWLLDTTAPLTAEQRRAARQLAADTGLTVEARNPQRALGTIRDVATAAGFLLALGVLAFTIGLLRSETAGELPILAATGATSTIRRTLAATTGGALAMAGVLLGTLVAYAALVAGYGGFDQLGRVPVLQLGLLLAGIPTITAVASWLLSGSDPTDLTQPAIE